MEGVYFRVGGEAGKTNGLSWHVVENMFGHLQSLIEALAKYELTSDASPRLEEFEIELFDFRAGSAVPAFRLVPKKQIELVPIVEEQRAIVAERFDSLMSLANKGQYDKYFPSETYPEVKYEIAEELYGFIISAENSPLSIVRPSSDQNSPFQQIYRIPKFSREQSEQLLRPRKRRRSPEEPEESFALIQKIGKKRRIIDVYENKDTVLSIAPAKIILENRIYHLHNPLIFTVTKEDGNFVVENEMLDIYASGATIDEAEHDMYNEFDESFQLLNRLKDNELSDRLLRAKNMINAYVKEISEA